MTKKQKIAIIISVAFVFLCLIVLAFYCFCISAVHETPGCPDSSNSSLTYENSDLSSSNNDSYYFFDHDDAFCEKDPYFEIYDVTDYNDPSWTVTYKYYIYNVKHEIIDYGETERINPKINKINNRLLKLCVSYGTGANRYRYYDVQDNRISEWFSSSIIENDQLIVKLDKTYGATKIVIQDMFNLNGYYQEISVDFSERYYPIIEAHFIDENKVHITYNSAEDTTKDIIITL